MGGAAVNNASHCAEKSYGAALAASGRTSGPHLARNARTLASCSGLRTGAGSGIQRFIWNGPRVFARRSAAHAEISAGCINNAPHAPRPPALATAIDSEDGHAPAIGASRMGTLRPNRLQKESMRSRALFIVMFSPQLTVQ